MNLSDETGRQRLVVLLRNFLVDTDIPSETMIIIVDLLKSLSVNTDYFLRIITEANCAISDFDGADEDVYNFFKCSQGNCRSGKVLDKSRFWR